MTCSISGLKTDGTGAYGQGSESERRNAATRLESLRIASKKESWPSAACEAELIFDARAGDQLAFGELCRRYHNYVKWRAFRIVRNHEDAEDLAQDVFIRAYQHLQEFRGTSSFKTWITQIANNSALMLLRRRKAHSEANLKVAGDSPESFIDWEVPDPALNPEEIYLRNQISQILKEAMRNLPPPFRSLMERYHANELELHEAALALGITKSAAKSRLFRARVILRRLLTKAVFEHGRGVPPPCAIEHHRHIRIHNTRMASVGEVPMRIT
jgi:RNA polymerase sigma-70 factor, ECF subfamily